MIKTPKRGAFDYLLRDPLVGGSMEDVPMPPDPPKPARPPTNVSMQRLIEVMPPRGGGGGPRVRVEIEILQRVTPKPPRPWVVQLLFWLLLCLAIGLLAGRSGHGQPAWDKPTAFPPTWYGPPPQQTGYCTSYKLGTTTYTNCYSDSGASQRCSSYRLGSTTYQNCY